MCIFNLRIKNGQTGNTEYLKKSQRIAIKSLKGGGKVVAVTKGKKVNGKFSE